MMLVHLHMSVLDVVYTRQLVCRDTLPKFEALIRVHSNIFIKYCLVRNEIRQNYENTTSNSFEMQTQEGDLIPQQGLQTPLIEDDSAQSLTCHVYTNKNSLLQTAQANISKVDGTKRPQ